MCTQHSGLHLVENNFSVGSEVLSEVVTLTGKVNLEYDAYLCSLYIVHIRHNLNGLSFMYLS